MILTGMRIILNIPWLWDIISKRSLLFNHPDCLLMTFFVLNSKLVEFVWGACNCKKFFWLVPNFSFLSSADYGNKIVYLDLKSKKSIYLKRLTYSLIFLIIKKAFPNFWIIEHQELYLSEMPAMMVSHNMLLKYSTTQNKNIYDTFCCEYCKNLFLYIVLKLVFWHKICFETK